MAAVIQIFLACDRCGKNFGEDQRSLKVEGLRKLARRSGWGFSLGKDVCPRCLKKRGRPFGWKKEKETIES